MKQFLVFVKKEFYHILRDRRTLLIVIGMPIVQIILFGFAVNMETKNLKTVFVTNKQDVAVNQIVEKFKANPYFKCKGYENSISDVETLFKRGKIDVAIVFENDFGEKLNSNKIANVQVISNTIDPNRGSIASNYALAIIYQYQKEINNIKNIPFQISTESQLVYNPGLKSAFNFVPGLIGLVMMIICAIMTSVSIVKEKEFGTMEVLLASPVKPITIVIAKTIPYIVVSFVNLITILLLSFFVLKVPIIGNLLLLLAGSTLFIFVALSLGLFISSVVDKQFSAIIIAGIGLMMPTLIFSGMLFPIASMPQVLQVLSNIIPAKWLILFVKKVMIEGQGFAMVAKETVIMASMALVLIVFSIVKFKKRLE